MFFGELSGVWGCAVTVRVTTLKGADAGAYYVEQLPNYYLQSGEPRGVWHGTAATPLGLSGEVADDDFLALMAGADPRQPDRRLGRCYDDGSVRGFDATASAPKSVSLLWAFGDEYVRGEVVAAHDAAVAAMAGWIEDHAHTRYRIGGEVAVVDAQGIVAAAFRQHTSRALDPQLHTHLVIANRVKSPDGRWLALDARTIKRDQRTLSALYHAGLRAELTGRLGVEWNTPVNGIAEIAGVDEALLREFSARTAEVHRRTIDKLERFEQSMGRPPTTREAARLEREAVYDSRPSKVKQVDAEVLHAGWCAQAAEIGFDPAQVVGDLIGRSQEQVAVDPQLGQVVARSAIGALIEAQSTWRPAELVREIAAHIPTHVADTASSVVGWASWLADAVGFDQCVDISRPVPERAMLRTSDRRPVSESAIDRALTTQAILDQERALIEWAERTLARGGLDEPCAIGRSRVPLTVPQAETAAAVAGNEELVLVVGPAGTGKTTALCPAVDQLRADGRAVFGVAPSANAAQVLAEETGVDADTIHKLLIEHHLPRPPDHRYSLPAGATVIVDEAGMLPTAQLAQLVNLAAVNDWRLALVGDPQQFTAVGRGGMFELLVDTFGAIELDRVHRFDQPWERDASLRLRRGDLDIAETYDTQGRLHAGTPQQMMIATVRHWWLTRQAGDTALLMTQTNETALQLSQLCQNLRIRAGELDPHGRAVDLGDFYLLTGDEIVARHNDRRLLTDRGDMVRNRSTWTIDVIHRDGSLTVHGDSGRVHLPVDYVAEHVELGYARTAMGGGQGRTVTTGLLYCDGASDVRTLYTGLTRGTRTNQVFFGTTPDKTARDRFEQSLTIDWIDRPAHTRQAELARTHPESWRPTLAADPTPAHPTPPLVTGPELSL